MPLFSLKITAFTTHVRHITTNSSISRKLSYTGLKLRSPVWKSSALLCHPFIFTSLNFEGLNICWLCNIYSSPYCLLYAFHCLTNDLVSQNISLKSLCTCPISCVVKWYVYWWVLISIWYKTSFLQLTWFRKVYLGIDFNSTL